LSRPMSSDRCATAGFTIIEVLVALAILSAGLAAIGTLIATSLKGVRTVEQRVNLLQAARAIRAGLPKRGELALGELDGELAGHGWRVNVLPFFTDLANRDSPSPWVPRTVAVTVRSPSGAIIRIDTVRLVRKPVI
jgi:general secretion pathway protein I